jgi:nucleotide-binding universal stress UspA family protein
VRLLLGTDGSEIAHEAAVRAGKLLAGADIDAVTILAVITSFPGDDAGGIEGPVATPEEAEREVQGEEAAARAAIDAIAAALPAAWQGRVTPRVEAGDAGPMIVWVAEHERSDMIVVGSHGHGVLKRIVLGSVGEHVVRHAPCPVLVVRAHGGAPDSAPH